MSEEVDIIYENDHYRVIIGLSEKFIGPQSHNSSHLQFRCYQIVNKETKMTELETFMLPQAIEDANHLSNVLNSIKDKDKEEAITADPLADTNIQLVN